MEAAVQAHYSPTVTVHGSRRSNVAQLGPRQHRAPCPRLRATPELDAFLAPKLVPGSPAATGDVSSLIPVSALMLLFYLVANWVVPEMLMKRLQPKAEEDATAPLQEDVTDGQIDHDATGKIQLKVKKKKRSRKAMKV